MGLCRECDVVLWRRREICPACSARSPRARVGTAVTGAPVRHTRLAVAVAASALPSLLVVDRALRWLLTGG